MEGVLLNGKQIVQLLFGLVLQNEDYAASRLSPNPRAAFDGPERLTACFVQR
jgi:hypothetical protein